MDKPELESLLSRLRESTLFLIKSDAVVFAGIFTLIGALKLELEQALQIGGSLTWALNYLVTLLIVSLIYEAIITAIPREGNSKKNVLIANVARIGYFILVVAHTLTATYTLGYVIRFLEIFSGLPR